jgi:hypothetical protein
MSTPFINPYETKDVVSTSLNNLDKQSQDIVSYLDGLFSSETIKDKQLILDDGTVETLKPFQVANNQGAFWDKGTTYYFQPVADRLREISLELQGRLQQTDVSASLKDGLTALFSNALDDSRTQVSNNSTDQYASTWTYEKWYNVAPGSPINITDLDEFLNKVGTAAFKMADASSDEDTNTKAVTNNSALKINVNLDGVVELLDDGDNFYNDNSAVDDPNTLGDEGVHDSDKQPEFYLIGNKKLPVFGVVENTPNPADLVKYPGGTANADYKRDLYNYQNKRIDPNSIYWNDPLAPKEAERVFFDMVAIAITQQKLVGSVTFADSNSIRNLNNITAQAARNSLKSIAGNYFTESKAWYDSVPAPSRNLSTASLPTPPSFFLSTSTNGTINYSNYDGSYGVFKPTEPGTLTSLISNATGLSTADVNATLTNWNTTANPNYVERITQYYTQSYINASITSTFGKKDAAISTKNFLIHEALNNLEPSQNPYIQEVDDPATKGKKIVVEFDKLLGDVAPSGYLRSSVDPVNTQMTQLMDLFLENFDITASRYVEDKRTLVDLFSGKLLKTAGENTEVQKTLFQNINSATKDITSQIKNALTRGIAESAESQFTLDLFNQTAVRKEDYGLSPNPADPSEHFLPNAWANTKDKFLPAMYYYNPANNPPISGSDEANNTLNGPAAKNGLPAGFPIMDVRDFDQFFKATKLALTKHIRTYLSANIPLVITNNLSTLYNEMGSFLTDPTILGTYPSWTTAGFTAGSESAIFGDLSDQTNFSRAIQLYKSLDKIIDNMQDSVSSVEQDVPKIPRPTSSSVINPNTGLAVTLTLQSSIAGYGDKSSPALVKSFLEMHEDTKTNAASPENSLQQISHLINTFDDYSKFSQNNAFEKIYAGEVFEADKQNYTSLNAKKSEPGPDGSMPEDKGVPKPLMAALSSSILVAKLGQVLVNKVNDIVAENDVVSINTVTRKDGPNANTGKIDTTTLSGSKESQTYLTNILSQVNSLSAGNLSVDVSAVGALISNDIETGMKTLITNTDNDAHRMVFIDDKTIDELINLRSVLNGFSATGDLLILKNKLNELFSLNLGGLKSTAYQTVTPTNNAPGYLKFSSLSDGQKKLINDIRDGKFRISGSTYTLEGLTYTLPATNIVPVDVPDNILNTLGTLAANITAMLNASTTETPPRIVGATPILTEINDAKLNFTALTDSADTAVAYNTILDADVYEAGPPASTVTMASLLRTDAEGGNATDRAKAADVIKARKELLDGLLITDIPLPQKKIGGVLISRLARTNLSNPYHNLLVPTTYSALDPANLIPPLPSNLTSITTRATFQTHIGNIETFISDFQTNLNNAKNETPPRDITLASDPILSLNSRAQLNFTELENPLSTVWTGITDPLDAVERTTIKQRLIDSNVGALPLVGHPNETNIRAARKELLEFFLEGQPITDAAGPPYPASYTLTGASGIKNHIRYKNLITPVTTYTYPPSAAITGLDDLTASTNPLTLNSTVDNSKADSFTLREVMGCDKDFTGGDVAFRDNTGAIIGTTNDGFPNSLNDLEFKMRNVPGEFTGVQATANKKLYIRKMQHFNVLFNTLSGGTAKNPPLASFAAPPTLFGGPPPTQNLKQYIESLATSGTITGSAEFDKIVEEVRKLAPINENINALEVSLAGEIKKPKAGPESEIYSTLHLFTQIENQTTSTDDLEAGMIQLLNKRKIKDDTKTPAIVDLEHRAATAVVPKDGLYQYSGYEANIQYLDPTNPLSISGPNIAPATTGNQGWNIQALLATKGIDTTTDLPPFPTLTKARDFLVALNEVYKDMQASKSSVIKEQLKVFDLWLRNNSFSAIGDVALGGKDSLEADINILDHIQEGGGTSPTTINDFLKASKQAIINNKAKLEDLDDIRTAGKGFAQRIDDGLSASALRNYFQKNIFYLSATPLPKAGPADTRADFTKDFFGRTLDNSNLPVFGVNIFGLDPDSGTTYAVPPDIQTHYGNANSINPYTAPAVPPAPPLPDAIASNSFKNFGRIQGGVPVLDNPYEKIMDNFNILLNALTAAEALERSKEQGLYRVMIKNLLGESGGVPDAQLIAGALAENPNSFIPNHPSLVNALMGLTYNTNNYPSTNLRTKILDVRNTIGDAIDPAKYDGVIPIPNTTLANFSLMSKADQATNVRSVGVGGKSIQELAILLYIMQMFEASNWDFEKYINDTSRYEMEPAVE